MPSPRPSLVTSVVPTAKGNELQPFGLGRIGFSAFQHAQSTMHAPLPHFDSPGSVGPVIKGPVHDGNWKNACQVFGVDSGLFQRATGTTAEDRSV